MAERHVYPMGVVGNCAFMAHVDVWSRVVWMCLPRFDSTFVFGRLLDTSKGGELTVSGVEPARPRTQEYVRNTNVLRTAIETDEGVFCVTDCAPRFEQYGRYVKPLMLIRKLEPIAGNPRVKIICTPRGDYGSLTPKIYVHSNHIRYDLGAETLRLNSNIPLSYVASEKYFVLNEPKYLVLTWGVRFEAPLESTAEDYLRRTIDYWQLWVRSCAIGRFYQKQLIRSALVLKLHQFEDTGAIIAAGTTSLPEFPGSARNWDYRYCWLRDAYYTLNAFNRISQFEEMLKFAHFIEDIAASVGRPRYPPVVRIDGTMEIPERVLPLSGYDGSGMVRVGNDAWSHVQNDIYGQILYALLQSYIDERFPQELRTTSRSLIMTLLAKMQETLGEPDATLWELRGKKMRHGYSALFHWVGGKAAAQIAEHLGDREMLSASTRLVARSAREVEACYDADRGAYLQGPDSKHADASLLQLITLHFLDPKSNRAARHLHFLETELGTDQGLIHRYVHRDDFGRPETAFMACAFWYVEALAAMGRIDDAVLAFEQLLGYSNHLGLFSEHVDPVTGSQWGNFPQTYSHVGLMSAVARISSLFEFPEFF